MTRLALITAPALLALSLALGALDGFEPLSGAEGAFGGGGGGGAGSGCGGSG